VATQVAAAEAGADIVDACIDSMSGLTSQPNMGSLVNALRGTRLDTGVDPKQLLVLTNYWCERCAWRLWRRGRCARARARVRLSSRHACARGAHSKPHATNTTQHNTTQHDREATRELYAPFESNMRYSSTDVYQHEMPGGQYTNLKFQAASLGLGESWDKVQQSYAAANRCVSASASRVFVRGNGRGADGSTSLLPSS
jgi:pyruvate carboxylase